MEIPEQDINELFQRMIFNIVFKNTDDHLKNHAFLFENNQWRLSPAYDITFSPSMMNGVLGGESSLTNAMTQYHRFGLSKENAQSIINDILLFKNNWETFMKNYGVLDQDIDFIKRYLDPNCKSQFKP